MLYRIKIPTIYSFRDLEPKRKTQEPKPTNDCFLFYSSKEMDRFLKECAIRASIK